MLRNKSLGFMSAVLLVVLTVILATVPGVWASGNYKTLHEFTGGKNAGDPGGLVFDKAGNLYGAASVGGAHRGGIVFKLVPDGHGNWTESPVYSFCSLSNCNDGSVPGASLVFDRAGNLYGTTEHGGAGSFCPLGCGVVFELTPKTDGSWTERVLYSFCSKGGCTDGNRPLSGVVLDSAGNLYGTTVLGGKPRCEIKSGCGVVFRLVPNADGSWTESVLHTFCVKSCSDGAGPNAGLIFDAAGNVYGTSANGGQGYGTVFELTPRADGRWKETTIHQFTGKDGGYPYSALIFDQAGNLYGTTADGGDLGQCQGFGCGVVFKLTPNSKHGWKETVLHKFAGRNGAYPDYGLIFDQAGNLYGTTGGGGNLNYCRGFGCGVVFKLVPSSTGGWDETVLHYFVDHPGAIPDSALIFDTAGNLYGTTLGETTYGSVFEITP